MTLRDPAAVEMTADAVGFKISLHAIREDLRSR